MQHVILYMLGSHSLYDGLRMLNFFYQNPGNSGLAVVTYKSVRMRIVSRWRGCYTGHDHLHTITLTVVQLPSATTHATVLDTLQLTDILAGQKIKQETLEHLTS